MTDLDDYDVRMKTKEQSTVGPVCSKGCGAVRTRMLPGRPPTKSCRRWLKESLDTCRQDKSKSASPREKNSRHASEPAE